MTLPIIKLQMAHHDKHDVVQLHFVKNDSLLKRLRLYKQPIRWSKTMNCWYLPASITIKQELFQILNGYAWLDYSDLQMPLIEHTYQASGISTRASELSSVHGVKVRSDLPLLNEAVLKKVLQFTNWLKSKRYSDHTIDTYTDALTLFLRFHHPKAISDLTNQDVITFNTDYILKHKLSASYQNQVVNALKLFLKTIENRSMDIELIHRPKREKILPNVLSKEEVKRILNAHSNLKHKAMLSLIYSCGLRRSELLNLKITDVDSKRNLLIVRQAKGAKDRIVPLSQKTLELLRSYFIACRPKRWLFEGQAKETPYDASSLAAVLKQALEKCNITKPVTLHWLRHSYATHLLESGTDLRYIQVILGHSRSTTTEIYTHVSNNSIQKVTTPFDSL